MKTVKVFISIFIITASLLLHIKVLANEGNLITPSADFIVERIMTIGTIIDAAAATEETDPNNLLHKQGGYQDVVYFRDSRVDWSLYSGKGVVEVATKGGGSIEVFSSVEGAEARNTYLATFDSYGALYSGSHYVFGTCVIRTSKFLTATQQNELTLAIVNAILSDTTPGQVQNPTTIYNGVDYSEEYDPQTYYDNNPDLQIAIGTDGYALIKHYVEYGKSEGRIAK